jgi:pimeloyl-ACP methyl ester carboxylesterase/ketosteroid isomerase-like protein
MKLLSLLFFLISFSGFAQQSPDSLYHNFTKAYDDLDAEKIANLYAENAEMLNLYDGENANSFKGQVEIRKYFQNFFQRFKAQNQKIQLTFKIIDRKKIGENILDNGFYRLEILTPNKPSFFTFGKFSTILEWKNDRWKFKTDATTNTDFTEYENAISTTIPTREELLYPPFYDELLGDYVTENNQIIVIGRSQTRLFAYFENTNQYRGLNKVNATTWNLGKTIISNEIVQTLKFKADKVEIYEHEKLISTATKKQFYKNKKVSYKNSKGVKLGGTLFIPEKSNGKAIVLVHGSGPQDRNGYASIIRLLADIFAREGITVLTYDKQGVGDSEGNYEVQNFTSLAQDALAGITFLKSNKALLLSKIGLGGSSQAGWIIAKAIEQNNQVDFALTIGAAGSGIDVVEQNLHNTEVLMKCTGTFSEKQITNAIAQQKYFFNFLANPKNAKYLDDFTENIEKDTLIRDWLFPRSTQVDLTNRNQWFTALEVNFNPLSVWKNYKNPVLMTLSEFDDSTPTKVVKSKVDNLTNGNIKTVVFNNAQHIGLVTDDVCKGDIANLTIFHKDFFTTLKKWLSSI